MLQYKRSHKKEVIYILTVKFQILVSVLLFVLILVLGFNQVIFNKRLNFLQEEVDNSKQEIVKPVVIPTATPEATLTPVLKPILKKIMISPVIKK